MHNHFTETHSVGSRTREQIVTSATCSLLKRYHIQAVGITDARRGFEWVRSRPSDSVILVCCNGAGRVLSGGEWRTCDANRAYVTPPGVLHAYHADRRAVWKLAWIHFADAERKPKIVRTNAPELLAAESFAFHAAIHGLYRETTSNAQPSVQAAWLELLQHHIARLTHSPRAQRLWPLWNLIDENIARAWTLNSLAREAAMSAETLRRIALQEVGRTPMEQLAHLRMRRAAGLLLTTDHKLDHIARLVGYENIFTFSTAFKRVIGVPPSRYRAG